MAILFDPAFNNNLLHLLGSIVAKCRLVGVAGEKNHEIAIAQSQLGSPIVVAEKRHIAVGIIRHSAFKFIQTAHQHPLSPRKKELYIHILSMCLVTNRIYLAGGIEIDIGIIASLQRMTAGGDIALHLLQKAQPLHHRRRHPLVKTNIFQLIVYHCGSINTQQFR